MSLGFCLTARDRAHQDDEESCTEHKTFRNVNYDKHGDGCAVVFPVRLYPHVKFAPLFYSKVDDSVVPRSRDFSEVVTVSVVKERC